MPQGITQCYLPPGRGDIPALTPAEAGARLSDPAWMQVIVGRPPIKTSKVSTLLSTKTSYNDDVRRQQDEHRSDVQKSKQLKTVKLAKNVKITQEHLSMHAAATSSK